MEPKKKEPKQSTKARVTQRKPRERIQEAMLDDPDPGMTQKQNQNQERDDPLAA